MSKLEELILKYCPDGVERVKLEDVSKSICTGLNPRSNFILNTIGARNFYVTVKEISTNQIVFSSNTDKISDEAWKIIENRSHLEKGDILFSGIGTIGKVVYVDIDVNNWNCSESLFIIKPKESVNGKFLAYILKSDIAKGQYEPHSAGSIMKGVRKETLKSLLIPLPPLPVQEEIVRILDSMVDLQNNIEAEIKERKKQYEHYREQILGEQLSKLCPDGVEREKLESLLAYEQPSQYIVESESYDDSYKTPVLTAGQTFILGYTNETEGIYTASVENPVIIFDDFTTSFHWVDFDFKVKSSAMKILKSKTENNFRFIFYAMQLISFVPTEHSRHWISKYSRFTIPLPPLPVQEEIVRILDSMTALQDNLEAELAERRKQYEYYRNKILSFE